VAQTEIALVMGYQGEVAIGASLVVTSSSR
jgi:hypothetical protein